jgi:hypothetical protein
MSNEAIQFSIGGDAQPFVRELGRAKEYATTASIDIDRKLAGIGKGAGGGAGMLSRIGPALAEIAGPAALATAGLVAVAAAYETMTKAVEKFGHIEDLSERTGLSPEFLQKLSDAADQSGTSVDAVAKSVAKFARELVNAQDGDAFSKEIQSLGLSVEDLRRKSPEDLFTTIANAVGGIEDPTRRSAVAMDVFGKSGAELIPVVANIGDALNTVGQLSADQVSRIDALGDAWTAFKNDAVTAGGALLSDLQPAILEIVNGLRDMVAALRGVGILADELASGSSLDDAFKKAKDFINKKHDEIWKSSDSPKARGDVDASADTPSGGGGSGAGSGGGSSSPKTDPSKTPQEIAAEKYRSDPKNYKNGQLRNPGQLRALDRAAANSRTRADRQANAIGGETHHSPQDHPTANDLAQANNLYNGDNTHGGFGLTRQPLNRPTAQDLWDEKMGRNKMTEVTDSSGNHYGIDRYGQWHWKHGPDSAKKDAAGKQGQMADQLNGQNGGGGSGGGKDDKSDPLAKMSEDIKAIREVIKAWDKEG